jgi:hypothetical protein
VAGIIMATIIAVQARINGTSPPIVLILMPTMALSMPPIVVAW